MITFSNLKQNRPITYFIKIIIHHDPSLFFARSRKKWIFLLYPGLTRQSLSQEVMSGLLILMFTNLDLTTGSHIQKYPILRQYFLHLQSQDITPRLQLKMTCNIIRISLSIIPIDKLNIMIGKRQKSAILMLQYLLSNTIRITTLIGMISIKLLP